MRNSVDGWFLHLPTGVVGKVTKWFDGDEEKYTNPEGETLVGPVVRFHNAHHFLAADPSVFLRLTDQEVRFHEMMQRGLVTVLKEFAAFAVATKIPEPQGPVLIAAAFQSQARALAPTEPPGAF